MENGNYRLDDFFTKYRNMVIRNAYLFVKDYHTAEDICQEVFIRLGRNLTRVPPEKVRVWLLCVSERLALDYLRKGGKYEINVGIDESNMNELVDEYYDVGCLMVEREETEYRGTALERLKKEKPLWYETICMSYVEEMDNASIGEAFGIKPSLVSKWKERAKRWLRSVYEEEYDKRDS